MTDHPASRSDGLRLCALGPADVDRLLAFYRSLAPETVYVFEPFSPVDESVLGGFLTGCETGSHLGFALVSPSGEVEGHGFLSNLAGPTPEFGIGLRERIHGRGWGRRLMSAVIGAADYAGLPLVTLTVFKTNHRARTLYESFGFRALRDHTVHEPADSVYMERRRVDAPPMTVEEVL